MNGGPDFSFIHQAADPTTAVGAMVMVAYVLALVGFVKWASKKISKFFD